MKRAKLRLALDFSQYRFCRVGSSLHGYLGQSRQGLALGVHSRSQIADDVDVWVIGNSQVGFDLDSPSPVCFSSRASRQNSSQWRGRDAARPDYGLRSDRIGSLARFDRQTRFVHVLDHRSTIHLDAELGKRTACLARQVFCKRHQYARRAIQQNDLRLVGVYGTEVLLQCLPRDLSYRPRKFNPSGTGTNDYEREPSAALYRITNAFGDFESVENLGGEGGG